MHTILTDVIPAKARKYVYAVLAIAFLVITAYKASEGDWLEMALTILTTLGFGTAASNTYDARHD